MDAIRPRMTIIGKLKDNSVHVFPFPSTWDSGRPLPACGAAHDRCGFHTRSAGASGKGLYVFPNEVRMMHASPLVDLAPAPWTGDVVNRLKSSPHALLASEDHCLLVTIGILAHNEERSLAATIASLFAQSLLSGQAAIPRLTLEVVVVPNGCTDATVAVARARTGHGGAVLCRPQSRFVAAGGKERRLERPGS